LFFKLGFELIGSNNGKNNRTFALRLRKYGRFLSNSRPPQKYHTPRSPN
jgi:hypothetical protein